MAIVTDLKRVSAPFALPAYTTANRPAANSVDVGSQIIVTDAGNRRVIQCSNGTNWISPYTQTLYSLPTTQTFTGATSAQELASASIPGNFLHPNSQLEVTVLWGKTVSSANNVTLRLRLGTTNLVSFNTSTNNINHLQRTIVFSNSLSSQVSFPSGASGSFEQNGNALATGTVDFSASQTINCQLQLANTGETSVVYQFLVQLLT